MENNNKAIRMLAIDDDQVWLETLEDYFEEGEIQVTTCPNPSKALDLCRTHRPDVILLDLVLPGVSGMELLSEILDVQPAANVLLVTGEYSTESAVEAIKKGAYDYLNKPVGLGELRDKLQTFIEEAWRRERVSRHEKESVATYDIGGIITQNPQMLEVLAVIRRVAPHYRMALISGETGTGKELIAQALHRASPVSNRPMVICNCAALTETLIESTLFGYVKGAFTGATENRTGVFEHANGGTLFLDEVGEMPLALQPKLLRVLQTGDLQRLGSPAMQHVDVRVIAATNRDLRSMSRTGSFREDLFYRLSVVSLAIPPLRERKEDLPLLQSSFLQRFASKYGRESLGISHRARRLLNAHKWPGNVRELEHVIGTACMMVPGDTIDVPDLPEYLRQEVKVPIEESPLTLEEMTRRYIHEILASVEGNKAKAAEILGIGRSTLYRFLGEERNEDSASSQ